MHCIRIDWVLPGRRRVIGLRHKLPPRLTESLRAYYTSHGRRRALSRSRWHATAANRVADSLGAKLHGFLQGESRYHQGDIFAPTCSLRSLNHGRTRATPGSSGAPGQGRRGKRSPRGQRPGDRRRRNRVRCPNGRASGKTDFSHPSARSPAPGRTGAPPGNAWPPAHSRMRAAAPVLLSNVVAGSPTGSSQSPDTRSSDSSDHRQCSAPDRQRQLARRRICRGCGCMACAAGGDAHVAGRRRLQGDRPASSATPAWQCDGSVMGTARLGCHVITRFPS
jgi:hypothetical protein